MNSSLFHEVYQICTDNHGGAFVPEAAARLIAARTGLAVVGILQELTTPAVYLYDDVHPVLDRLFALPGPVPIIWTEGELATDAQEPGYQMLKVAASELLDRYPDWRTRTERIGLPPVIGGFTKRDALAPMRSLFEAGTFQQVLVVDDSPAQLTAAADLFSSFSLRHHTCLHHFLHLFLIDRGQSPPVDVPRAVTRIQRLTVLSQFLSAQQRTLLLLDLDYTLIDHARTRQEMAARIGRMCAGL